MPVTILRWFLLPVSLLYGIVMAMRNFCYNIGLFKQTEFEVPLICVGNLSTGGTGKSPMVIYILNLLISRGYKVATLSRGYGRTSKGFRLITKDSNANESGDEPLMFAKRFPELVVAVCEKRGEGIRQILARFPDMQVIVLDDAFQHRSVKAGFNILLTCFDRLYSNDFMLPTGNLREFRCGRRRADLIVVTKSLSNLEIGQKQKIISRLKPKADCLSLFSFLDYSAPQPINRLAEEIKTESIINMNGLAVSGIATPDIFEKQAGALVKSLSCIRYSDHHSYSKADIQEIKRKFDTFAGGSTILLTTEKDVMRLCSGSAVTLPEEIPIFFIPVGIGFSAEDKEIFDNQILQYARQDQTNN